MYHERPYSGDNREQIRALFKKKAKLIQLNSRPVPAGWSPHSTRFVADLLMRAPALRLGYYAGVDEIKNHEWFNGFDWEALEERRMQAPFIPSAYRDNFCAKDVEKPLRAEKLEKNR